MLPTIAHHFLDKPRDLEPTEVEYPVWTQCPWPHTVKRSLGSRKTKKMFLCLNF